MKNRRLAAVLVTAALVAPASLALAGPADAATGTYYSSCTKLAKDYPHGVAKGAGAASAQVAEGYGRPAYGKKAREVYARNRSRLDRDGDGTACER
jgi:hypothetical protein